METWDVQAWCGSVRLPQHTLRQLALSLSVRERNAARHFIFRKDGDQFLACRGLLRAILGANLGRSAGSLEIRTGLNGKPGLPGNELFFNVSHSGDLAAIACARGRHVGIDVQAVSALRSPLRLAERYFCRAETNKLKRLAGEAQRRAVCSCWARKEAYAKALGEGLSIPLCSFEVSVLPDEPVRLLRAAPGDTCSWRLQALDAGPGYAAAIAVEGDGWHLRSGTWDAEGHPTSPTTNDQRPMTNDQ